MVAALGRRPGIGIQVPKVACESQAAGDVLVAINDDQESPDSNKMKQQLLTARSNGQT